MAWQPVDQSTSGARGWGGRLRAVSPGRPAPSPSPAAPHTGRHPPFAPEGLLTWAGLALRPGRCHKVGGRRPTCKVSQPPSPATPAPLPSLDPVPQIHPVLPPPGQQRPEESPPRGLQGLRFSSHCALGDPPQRCPVKPRSWTAALQRRRLTPRGGPFCRCPGSEPAARPRVRSC